MNLTPREKDKLMVAMAAEVARKRLARGVKLNHPEAIALITDAVVEGARDGRSVAEMMQAGAQVITRDQCMPGVAEMIHDVQVEATFPGRHQAGDGAQSDPLRCRATPPISGGTRMTALRTGFVGHRVAGAAVAHPGARLHPHDAAQWLVVVAALSGLAPAGAVFTRRRAVRHRGRR